MAARQAHAAQAVDDAGAGHLRAPRRAPHQGGVASCMPMRAAVQALRAPPAAGLASGASTGCAGRWSEGRAGTGLGGGVGLG